MTATIDWTGWRPFETLIEAAQVAAQSDERAEALRTHIADYPEDENAILDLADHLTSPPAALSLWTWLQRLETELKLLTDWDGIADRGPFVRTAPSGNLELGVERQGRVYRAGG
jgi:hypothetical protein